MGTGFPSISKELPCANTNRNLIFAFSLIIDAVEEKLWLLCTFVRCILLDFFSRPLSWSEYIWLFFYFESLKSCLLPISSEPFNTSFMLSFTLLVFSYFSHKSCHKFINLHKIIDIMGLFCRLDFFSKIVSQIIS